MRFDTVYGNAQICASIYFALRAGGELFYFLFWQKKSRHRTTLPHSVVQYHRREASYRSCSGWEREFQACYRHREKIYKKEGRKAGRRGMLQIQRLLSDLLNYCRNVTSLSFFLGTVLAYGFEEKRWSSLTAD